ncbi:hypothetical protein AJ79_05731 [Helicocarpus griseus UAMH5409]|uniref:NAD(P)-binding protein n=1 Tax=Helicocarpus griseus UAMH5409 TaxID=1447875 RepID=A0A2B7XKM5_9EURO|nr:hypothetical protein AJ79_05731 [Helicocarpus griseus UAMH5409]
MLGDFPLSGKIVAITGGGSGIGLSFLQHALALNAKVLIGDIKLTPAAEKLISSRQTKTNAFAKCDVRKWNQLEDLIEKAKEIYGDVPDVYVPCAGLFEPPSSSFWDDAEQDTNNYDCVSLNISHPLKFTRMALRALVARRKKGVVLLISSIAGLNGVYAKPLYAATKHAIVGFVKSMGAAEEQFGVKIVGICPGITDTPIWDNEEEFMASLLAAGMGKVELERITEAMVNLVQKGEYTGGTVFLESAEGTNVVFEGIEKGDGKGWDAEKVPGAGRIGELMERERERGGKI